MFARSNARAGTLSLSFSLSLSFARPPSRARYISPDAPALEYFPAAQEAHVDHVPVKPLLVTELSDANVTFKNPVDELYTLDELRDPACLRMRCDDDSQLHV